MDQHSGVFLQFQEGRIFVVSQDITASKAVLDIKVYFKNRWLSEPMNELPLGNPTPCKMHSFSHPGEYFFVYQDLILAASAGVASSSLVFSSGSHVRDVNFHSEGFNILSFMCLYRQLFFLPS